MRTRFVSDGRRQSCGVFGPVMRRCAFVAACSAPPSRVVFAVPDIAAPAIARTPTTVITLWGDGGYEGCVSLLWRKRMGRHRSFVRSAPHLLDRLKRTLAVDPPCQTRRACQNCSFGQLHRAETGEFRHRTETRLSRIGCRGSLLFQLAPQHLAELVEG